MEKKNERAPQMGFPQMTLRDYFAAKALQGYWASCVNDHEGARLDWLDPAEPHELAQTTQKCVASCCYVMADAMLKAREQ